MKPKGKICSRRKRKKRRERKGQEGEEVEGQEEEKRRKKEGKNRRRNREEEGSEKVRGVERGDLRHFKYFLLFAKLIKVGYTHLNTFILVTIYVYEYILVYLGKYV